MKSLVMKHAWEMARAWAAAYDVPVKEMLSACLKAAWAAAKEPKLQLRGNGEKVTVYLGGVWLCSCWGNDKASVIAGVVELGRVAVGVNKLRLRIAYRMLVPKNPLANLI